MANLNLPPRLESVVWQGIHDDLLEVPDGALDDKSIEAIVDRHTLRALMLVDVLRRKTPKILDGNLVVQGGRLTLLRPK